MQLYHLTKGDPDRMQIQDISERLNLSENKVYKWFWDTKQKNERNKADMLALEETGAKAAYNVEGKTGGVSHMTPTQVRFAMKLHKENEDKEEEFESIAKSLGIDIDRIA